MTAKKTNYADSEYTCQECRTKKRPRTRGLARSGLGPFGGVIRLNMEIMQKTNTNKNKKAYGRSKKRAAGMNDVKDGVMTPQVESEVFAYLEGLRAAISTGRLGAYMRDAWGLARHQVKDLLKKAYASHVIDANGNYVVPVEPEFFEGTLLKMDPEASLFLVKTDAGETIKVRSQGRLDFIPGDRVVLEPRVGDEGDDVKGLLVGLAHRRFTWVCRPTQTYEGLVMAPVKNKESGFVLFVPEALEGQVSDMRATYAVDVEDQLPADYTRADIANDTWLNKTEMPTLVAVRLMQTKGNSADRELEIAAVEHLIPIDFSPESLKESEALPDKVQAKDRRGREDLRDLPFVTIDGEDSRDFDDAVWAEKREDGSWRLLVAIADVSHYVKPGSALERDVQSRCTSVYFPTSVVPMLPEKLSNGLCSLNPKVDRLAMVADIPVSKNGVIDEKGATFYKAVIKSAARLTYTRVANVLNGATPEEEPLEGRRAEIQTLYGLYLALRRQRTRRFALDFETEETAAVFNDQGDIIDFKVREHNDAHRLIEEMMLAANVCAAKFVMAHHRDTLYRIHDQPDEERVFELRKGLAPFGITLTDMSPEAIAQVIEENRDQPTVQTMILRTMARAEYSPENIGHFGLQYEHYAHFTSPIRRYPDLLLHRVIKGILSRRKYHPELELEESRFHLSRHTERVRESEAERNRVKDKAGRERPVDPDRPIWQELGMMCSVAERRADDATRDVMNYLQCEWMVKHRRERFEASVTGVIDAGVFVRLEGKSIEGFVHVSKLGQGEWFQRDGNRFVGEYGTTMELGDTVLVRSEEVDLEKRRMSFVIDRKLTSVHGDDVKTRTRTEKPRREKRRQEPVMITPPETDFGWLSQEEAHEKARRWAKSVGATSAKRFMDAVADAWDTMESDERSIAYQLVAYVETWEVARKKGTRVPPLFDKDEPLVREAPEEAPRPKKTVTAKPSRVAAAPKPLSKAEAKALKQKRLDEKRRQKAQRRQGKRKPRR